MTNNEFDFEHLSTILNDLNQSGGFTISVLTDPNGFPISFSSGNKEDAETKAAVVAQIKKITAQVRGQLGMDATDEISLNDVSGRKLVCRAFPVKESEMMLAVLLPDRTRTYRRLTGQAIRAIQAMWVY